MPKIERKKQKIFCGDVPYQNNVAVFGSLKAEAPAFSDNPDLIQSLAAYGAGWAGAAVYNQAPAMQDLNALQYLFSRQLAYLMQSGIAEYLLTETYYQGSLCLSSGNIYKSLVDDNISQPLTDNTKWEQVTGNGSGRVPLGAIIPMTSGLTGAMAIPASGLVSDGFMRADGAAIPAGNKLSGTTPNLSNSLYLRGSTIYGTTGGSNTSTLITANLPSHTHSIDHDHGAFNSGGTSVNHSHSFSGTVSGGDHGHSFPVRQQNENGNHHSSQTIAAGEFDQASFNFGIGGGGHSHSYSGTTSGHSTDHSHSIDVPYFSGTSGATGSATAFSNEPSYINVIYLIRVN